MLVHIGIFGRIGMPLRAILTPISRPPVFLLPRATMGHPSAITLAAITGAFHIHRVRGIIGVTLRTMRRVKIPPYEVERAGSRQILLMGHCSEMIRIHAAPDTAAVIQLQTWGHVSVLQLPDFSMRTAHLPVHPDKSIALVVDLGSPEPTTGHRLGLDLIEESVGQIEKPAHGLIHSEQTPERVQMRISHPEPEHRA